MATKPTLTAERLREILDYDPETGVFRWKLRVTNVIRVGQPAGTPSRRGYTRIKVDGRRYMAHVLAWLYTKGCWPRSRIDHRNCIRDDNRVGNLREDLKGENAQNRLRPSRNSQSGFLGVSLKGGRWRAAIQMGGRSHHLGYFDSPEEASAAYFAAKAELHPFWDH